MVDTVLRAWVGDHETKVSDAQAKVEMTQQLCDRNMKEIEESASLVQYQEQKVTSCEDVLLVNREALKTAQETLQAATTAVADFDTNLKETIDQRDQCSSVYDECFALLKSDSAVHKVHMKPDCSILKRLEAMLKSLGTERSLLSAIVPALKKSPEERGPFDIMAVEGVEALFTKHLATFHEQIDNADALKAEKVAAQLAAQEAEGATTSKKTSSKAALKEEKQVLRLMQMQHERRLQDANSRATAAMEAIADHGLAEESLLEAKQLLSGFTELLEGQRETHTAVDVEMSKVPAGETSEALCTSKVDDTFEPRSMPSPTKSQAARADGMLEHIASPTKSLVA